MKDHYQITHPTKYVLLTALIAVFFCGYSFAQKKPSKGMVAKLGYKLYTNQQYHFQFEIPAEYKMAPSGDGEDYNLEAVTKADKKRFEDYNGIVFSLKVKKQSLESSLEGDFTKGTGGDYYFKGVLNDSLKKATKIVGIGFTGLKKVISCRVSSTESNGQTDSMVMDGCETIYISNGKITLCIGTNGLAIEDEDYDRIIKTLKFSD